MNKVSISNFPSMSFQVTEAVNTLCTNLTFSGENVKRIMITSCHASEGKSFLSMNLMRTMANFGRNVVLVDADLRRSRIRHQFGLQFRKDVKEHGLAHYLAGMNSEEDVIYQTNIPNAYFVPVGKDISNPLPLINSPRFKKLLVYLGDTLDYVFVDAPPVGTVIDAANIAKNCDGTLLVVNYNAIRRQELIEAKQQLEQTGCPILGTCLNMVRFDSYMSRKYYYKSYYSDYGYYDGNR